MEVRMVYSPRPSATLRTSWIRLNSVFMGGLWCMVSGLFCGGEQGGESVWCEDVVIVLRYTSVDVAGVSRQKRCNGNVAPVLRFIARKSR